MGMIDGVGNLLNGILGKEAGESIIGGIKTAMTTNISKAGLEAAQAGHVLNKQAAGVVNDAVNIMSRNADDFGGKEAVEKLAKDISGKNFDARTYLSKNAELMKQVAAKAGGDESAFAKAISSYNENAAKSTVELLGKDGKISSMTRLQGFFNDADYGSLRKKVVAGGYAAGAIGLRTLQGGDLTHNSRGENDIAGIPFV